MDGIHDVGGMDGFGPVDTTEHEDTFHHSWEGITYATFVAGMGSGTFDIDAFRHSIERMPPTDYLTSSYYDRWVRATTRLFVERGVLEADEVIERTRRFATGEASVLRRQDPDLLGELAAGVNENYGGAQDVELEPGFEPSDRVTVRNHNPEGHTRCPGYVRRSTGVVRDYRGPHTYPDASAHGDNRAEPLYTVEFDAADLWPERDGPREGDTVTLELWEPYLCPAEN